MTRPLSHGRRALVFGGRGFLGNHVTAALHADGFLVTVAGRRVTPGPGSAHCDLVRGPLPRLVDILVSAEPQVIVNCVGATTGTVADMVAANATAPARLITAVAAAAPRAIVIHLGSAAEYGVTPQGRPVTEDATCTPTSPYAMTKSTGTGITLALAADFGLRSVVLRVFNPIGAGAPASSMAGRAARVLSVAAAGRPQRDITMAPLDTYRDWVDARDVGRAVVAAARKGDALVARLYNIAGGHAVSARDVVGRIAAEVGFGARVHEDGGAPTRSAAIAWQQADISLAEHELGWRPQHSLADSVSDLCRQLFAG